MGAMVKPLALCIACMAISACSAFIDVDDYEFLDDRSNSVVPTVEVLRGQYSTGCLPSGDLTLPGEEYVITLLPGTPQKIRRDLINYNSTCQIPLWVEVLEGTAHGSPIGDGSGALGVRMSVDRYALKFVQKTALEGAQDNEFLGISDWQIDRWQSLLGVETLGENGESYAVNAGDDLFIRVEVTRRADDGVPRTVEFSHPVFDSLPVTTDVEAERTDGEEGVDIRFPAPMTDS